MPRLTFTVRETEGVARINEIVRSGVPLPRSPGVRSTAKLTIIDAEGTPIPAEFEVLARWNAGHSEDTTPIQWLLLTFPATVAANSIATYCLVMDGSAGANPSPAMPLSLIQGTHSITVSTGVATFVLGGNAGALFDEVRLANGTCLVSASELTATIESIATGHSRTRALRIEHVGPLAATVIVEGAYDLLPYGGSVGSLRRYLFTAGSGTAIVRHAVSWEGDRCPSNGWDRTCDADGDGDPEVNGVLVTRVRDALVLAPSLLSGPTTFHQNDNLATQWNVLAVGSRQADAVQGSAQAGEEAWVRQRLRDERTAPLAYDIAMPGTPRATGERADGALLAVGGPSGAIAVSLNHMQRYEPQALRLLADGRLAIDLVDDRVWLGQRQGLFATMAIAALPGWPERDELTRLVWAPLNHPLHAWPQPEWWAWSEVLDEIPVGALPEEYAVYDPLVEGVLERTLAGMDTVGLVGLLTFGVYPRYWGNPLYGDEIDCGSDDPTPGDGWDNAYWCGTWTDYHNTVATVPLWVARSGQVRWLDELAFPGALRTLHTQMMQCAPSDSWPYCDQIPAGYGGYRSDFNSEHAYLDNLFLYYWLTGDTTVVERIERGARAKRDYLCHRRPEQPCLPDDPPTDDWAYLAGRAASQWYAAFRFVGLASDDASFLEDWRSGLARAVTQHYVEAELNGVRYGFWLEGYTPVSGPGTYSTAQLWLASFLDMHNLYRLQRDTHDAPIGNPPLRPSQILAAWARTLVHFGATVSGDGTAGGRWPNALYFTWEGERIGGRLRDVTPNTGGSDPYLWATGKASLVATLMRAADATHDATLERMGADMTRLTLAAALGDGSPLGKVMGLYLSRLHAAVARQAGRRSLALIPGWNLVSMPLKPWDTAIAYSLASIAGQYDLVFAYEAADVSDPWKLYAAEAPPFVSDLSDIHEGQGLWIHATTPVTWTVLGTMPPAMSPIALRAGWNLVGYPSQATRPVSEALASLAGRYDLVYAFDAGDTLGPWKRFDAAVPPMLNELQVFTSGKGYWIRAREDCVWQVP